MDNSIDRLIDYLIEEGACDICGKCVNYTPWTWVSADDVIACKAKGENPEESVPTATCREGMKEWFKRYDKARDNR